MAKFLSFLLFLSLGFMPIPSLAGGVSVIRSIFVGKHGKVDFYTVQSAIDSIPVGNKEWTRIHVASGIYTEQVRIPWGKEFILLEGEGRETTTIVSSNALPNDSDNTGSDKISMDSVATFTSLADNIVVRYITFKNLYTDGCGMIRRAIAAYVAGDKTTFYDCGMISYQDTLFDKMGRHYFKNCYIEGGIDYIFGRGQSIYEGCTLFTVAHAPIGSGWITAQGRSGPHDANGFVFKFCNLVGNGRAYLGRAWGAFSRVVFFKSTMSEVIDPKGWDNWNQTVENLSDYEYQCTGPGSSSTGRVNWVKTTLSQRSIYMFSGNGYIDNEGWLERQP